MSGVSPQNGDDFHPFFELSLDMLCVVDQQDRFVELNSAWERELGWSSTELRGHSVSEIVHPDDAAEAGRQFRTLRDVRQSVSFRTRCIARDGSEHLLRWTASVDEAGTIYVAARDVTDFVDAIERSTRSEELWHAVLRTVVDPIVLIDAKGVIVRSNPATSSLFGYAQDELVGSNVSMLMPEPYRSEHDQYLQRYLETGEARIIGIGREVWAQKADGSVFPMALAVSEVEIPSGPMFTGLIHDLTARHAAEQALRDMNEQLEDRVRERTRELERLNVELGRSNRDLEQFAYIASHDLQAPLRNVRQGLELLDEHLQESVGVAFDAEAVELRDLTVAAVARMEDLIRGLLSYSRLQRKGPTFESVDLAKVVERLLEELSLEIEENGAVIEVGELPVVRGDPTQIHQLLQNLIQNALKYRSPQRPANIHLRSSRADGEWVVSIDDNGLGVDEDQHEKIFELFRRGHPGIGGVGLGLAICQRIVERHGGRIWVKSTPDDGSTFSFTFPRSEQAASSR